MNATTVTLGPDEVLPFVRAVGPQDHDNLKQLGQYLFTQVDRFWPHTSVPGVELKSLPEGEALLTITVYPLGLKSPVKVALPQVRIRGVSPDGKIRIYADEKTVVSAQEFAPYFTAACDEQIDKSFPPSGGR